METMNKLEKLYTRKELKEMGLGSLTYIDLLASKGILKKIKIGRNTRFKESDVLAFINHMEKNNGKPKHLQITAKSESTKSIN